MHSITARTISALIFAGTFGFMILAPAAYAADLDSITSVSHGGVSITKGQVVTRAELLDLSQAWEVSAAWPAAVSSGNSFLGVFRGSFGSVEGGSAVEGVTYASQQNTIFKNSNISKAFNLLALGDPNTASFEYTFMLAERGVGVSHQDTADWFASGGIGGVEPIDYALLTFTYDGTFIAEEINAITSIEHGDAIILEGDSVHNKNLSNPDSWWKWNFSWPSAVSNERALFVVFRGEFGALEGGAPIEGDNYAIQLQAFPIGETSISKQMNIPALLGDEASEGMYTAAIFELDQKYLGEGIAKQIEWFATGGAQGIPPLKYDSLTFAYSEYAECCSSIVFIPGIKATELYESNNRRWLPLSLSNEASRLAMNPEGVSLHDIKVGNPIEQAYGIVEIYGFFSIFLNELKDDRTISNWENFPYDWRYDVYDVVEQEQQLVDGSSYNMRDRIRELAEQSDTGKVTIIAHSNGGLVGKALIDALGVDAIDVVDQFVMVGSPQLGTPSTIGSMLHGFNQDLPGGRLPALLLDKPTARDLSRNMLGAFGLLPFSGYMDAVLDPVVIFEEGVITQNFIDAYGSTINTPEELGSFLAGTLDGRVEPDFDDTTLPIKLSDALLSTALETRDNLDTWSAPLGLKTVEIAGWGLDTVSGARYKEATCPFGIGCTSFLDARPVFTPEGDGTVITSSAIGLEVGDKYYFNMRAFNEEFGTSWNHANMLSASSTQEFIRGLVNGSVALNTFITSAPPAVGTIPRRLTTSVHSPISIGVRDSKGRFTGVIPNPDINSNIPLVLNEIPNSHYLEFGEGKYVGLDVGEIHEFVMEGTGTGTFTLEVEESEGGSVVKKAVYSDVSVSTSTIATISIQDVGSMGELKIDEDGDGQVDLIVEPDSEEDPDLFEEFRLAMEGLETKKHLKKKLVKTANFAERLVEKGQLRKAKRTLRFLKWFIAKQKKNLLSREDKVVLIEILNKLRESL